MICDLRSLILSEASGCLTLIPASARFAKPNLASRLTSAIAMIGEIGGDAEIQAAHYIRDHVSKPVAAFIAGQTAPKGKRMGHAGAIISGGGGTAAQKMAALEECGVKVAKSPATIGETLLEAMKGKKR